MSITGSNFLHHTGDILAYAMWIAIGLVIVAAFFIA